MPECGAWHEFGLQAFLGNARSCACDCGCVRLPLDKRHRLGKHFCPLRQAEIFAQKVASARVFSFEIQRFCESRSSLREICAEIKNGRAWICQVFGVEKGKKTGVFPIKFFAKMFEIFDFLSITKAIEFNLNCNLKGRK